MIEELKDLLLIFRKVYKEYFAMKFKARDAIKEYETKMIGVRKVRYLLSKIYSNLDEVFPLLPIKGDQQYIKCALQSTLNVLHYDAKVDEPKTKEYDIFLGFGLNGIYDSLYSKFEYDYKEIKNLYKEKKYEDVIERVEKMLNYLDNWYIIYH